MHHHSETRFLPYTAEQMFDLVADIERYPEFLPWCMAARVRPRGENEIEAELVIGHGPFRETFVTRDVLDRPHSIEVSYLRGPFRHLHNSWVFAPADGGSTISFEVEFEFRSRLFERLIGRIFSEAVRRMVVAFEGRARELYGRGAGRRGKSRARRTSPKPRPV